MPYAIAVGELLIDFTPHGVSENQNVLFERNPGGAPANLAVQLVRLGLPCGFIGKVGNDAFGAFLKESLRRNGVDTAGLKTDRELTTLAFVQLDEKGDRSFSFYRSPGADTQLRAADVDFSAIDRADLINVGSLLLTNEPSRSAVYQILEYAKSKGKRIAYDPNWRPLLWASEELALQQMRKALTYCDILKVSEEELAFLTGQKEIRSGVEALLAKGVQLVMVTMGPKGCLLANSRHLVYSPTYDVQVVDTTGSGDSSFAGCLFQVLNRTGAAADFEEKELREIADFANACGSVSASKVGGIPAMAALQEIETCMREVPRLQISGIGEQFS